MIKGSLADRLEYAILETIAEFMDGHQQDYWGGWEAQVRARGINQSELTQQDLLSAFKRLWKQGLLRLTKPNSQRREAHEYSGNAASDGSLFFTGTFNADITDEGRRYWDSIREEPRPPIGFSQ